MRLFNSEHVEIELKSLRKDVDGLLVSHKELLDHKEHCRAALERHEQESKRQHDDTKNLTESIGLLAKSTADNSLVMTGFTDKLTGVCDQLEKISEVIDLKNGAPALTFGNKMYTASEVNWKIFLGIVALAGGISAIIIAYQHLAG